MRETEYVRFLSDQLIPVDEQDRPRPVAGAIVGGMARTLPEAQRARLLGSGPLWPWTLNGPPAPDLLLADNRDCAVAVLEFKRADTATNWHPRSWLRDHPRLADPAAENVYRHYIDHTNPHLDAPHVDRCCVRELREPCRYWQYAYRIPGRARDLHRPVVHQADTYVATRSWVPASVTFGVDVLFLLIAPSTASASRFREDLVSTDIWETVWLAQARDEWERVETQQRVPDLGDVIGTTSRFLAAP